jgi:hypothetical protein
MGALLGLEVYNEDIEDSATYSEADRGVVVADLMVTAADEDEVLTKSSTVVRTAIHAIGGTAPGWPPQEHPA